MAVYIKINASANTATVYIDDVPFTRSDFRHILTGRVIAISRPMVEAILAELDRGGR